ncbi:uncharacterized protein LOC132270231 [Cornus florida]|uniref:uncharacterized protein LOC132270231 n=1 Tax=Cornus florida TaxID=4283 RepID=UPI00289AD4BD|nr:uncharacterized protein LOC132270231 [Cornus florida]
MTRAEYLALDARLDAFSDAIEGVVQKTQENQEILQAMLQSVSLNLIKEAVLASIMLIYVRCAGESSFGPDFSCCRFMKSWLSVRRGSVSMVLFEEGLQEALKMLQSRIWKQAVSCFSTGLAIDVSDRRARRFVHKRLQINLTKVSEIPLRRRTNIRSLSVAMEVAKLTLHRRIQEGVIRRHSNAVKPHLTDENTKERLLFCLSILESYTLASRPIFCNMYNFVHIDEKWFFMSKEAEKYYLLPEEVEPLCTCRNKRFITKVMFLAAVARLRFDMHRNKEFSGKIGIFQFTYKKPAKRNSKNRMAETLETKLILSVTKDVIRSCLIEKVLPAIRKRWLCSSMTETIFIQQDNARPHIDPRDSEFLEAACKDGFDIRLCFQPPNNPDMNVLDLGYFRAIQSLQHQQAPTTIAELIDAVEIFFNELVTETLNCVFLTLQECMIETMKFLRKFFSIYNNEYTFENQGALVGYVILSSDDTPIVEEANDK